MSFTKRFVPNKLGGRIRTLSGNDRDSSNTSRGDNSSGGSGRRSLSRSPHDLDESSRGGRSYSSGGGGSAPQQRNGQASAAGGGQQVVLPPSPPHHVSFSASGFGGGGGSAGGGTDDLDGAVHSGVPHHRRHHSQSHRQLQHAAAQSASSYQPADSMMSAAMSSAQSTPNIHGAVGPGGGGISSGGARPKKAWEWHYKSFLSKKAMNDGHKHQQEQQHGSGAGVSLEHPQLKASRSLSTEISSAGASSLDVRRRGGSPSSPILKSSPRMSPPNAGSGLLRQRSDACPSSAPVHSSDGRSVLKTEGMNNAVPPPPNLSSSMASSPPKVPSSFRRKSDYPQYQLGPRQQQQNGPDASESGDTAVRGGSFFKNMFKHGQSDGVEGHISSGPGADSLDGQGPVYPAHPGGEEREGTAMRNKAKSYDSLDTTVRKGNEVAYGGKGILRQTSQPRPQAQPYPHAAHSPTDKARSWDSKLYIPSGSSGDGGGDSSVGLDMDGKSRGRMIPGADIGPQGNAEKRHGGHRWPRDIKKAFTVFHNSKHYGKDTTSAFLGDEPSVRANNYFAVRYGGGPSGAPTPPAPLRPSTPSRASSGSMRLLKPVTEGVATAPAPCALKPISGTETWLKDRRYLIGPAVIAMCRSTVLSSLPLGSTSGKSGLAAFDTKPTKIHPYERVTIGKASIFGTLEDGDFAPTGVDVVLVLRQNYLFEYAEGIGLNERPGGFAHLQNSISYPNDETETQLYLDYYQSPCAGGDMTKLLLQVESRDERDKWVTCLTEAAHLKIEDLYDYDGSDEGLEFGRGRYATVRPAKRKCKNLSKQLNNENDGSDDPPLAEGSNELSSSTHKKCDCALKIISKNEFWSRVVKDRERADTLVRETAVQASLTAEMGHLPTFLRLRNFFETIDHVVLELDILQGTDLFQHISSKGIVDENEAAHIMRDILTCIDAMNRIGIAHRDVKPSNILMCHAEQGDGIAVKVGDFGMATFVGHDKLLRGRCGTPGYVAPEILRSPVSSGYKNNVDVFSAGVTLYVLLCGYEPFYGECDADLIGSNRSAAVEFPTDDWRRISIEGRDLVERMLHADPERRISASDALKHAWIRRRAPEAFWENGNESEAAAGEAACTVQ